MYYRLRENLHYCVAGGRTIFLDVEADRYFALPERADAVFRTIMGDAAAQDPDPVMLKLLLDWGLLCPTLVPPPLEPAHLLPPVRRGVEPGQLTRASLAMRLRVAWAQCFAALLLRTGSLAAILRRLKARRTMVGETGRTGLETEYAAIAAGFDALDPLFPRADRCLVRALAYLSLCLDRGLAPFLLFGVQTRPFSAHCWIQQGDIVLNDAAENVRTFAPILVV